jgi:hypothetical protein
MYVPWYQLCHMHQYHGTSGMMCTGIIPVQAQAVCYAAYAPVSSAAAIYAVQLGQVDAGTGAAPAALVSCSGRGAAEVVPPCCIQQLPPEGINLAHRDQLQPPCMHHSIGAGTAQNGSTAPLQVALEWPILAATYMPSPEACGCSGSRLAESGFLSCRGSWRRAGQTPSGWWGAGREPRVCCAAGGRGSGVEAGMARASSSPHMCKMQV